MRDERHLNELLEHLQTVRIILRAKSLRDAAGVVDEAATQLRILFDEVEELAAGLAETHERLRRAEQDREDLREEMYYAQDQRDEAREERFRQEERADELELRLDEARAIEAGLRADLAGMSEHHWTKGHE